MPKLIITLRDLAVAVVALAVVWLLLVFWLCVLG